MDKALLFLLKLAWDSRIRLPVLIVVGFLVLDIRMQLEINIQTRRIRRRPVPRHIDQQPEEIARNTSESSNESWIIVEDQDESDSYLEDIATEVF